MVDVTTFPAALYTAPKDLARAPVEALLPPIAAAKQQVSLFAVMGGITYTSLGYFPFMHSSELLSEELAHPSACTTGVRT